MKVRVLEQAQEHASLAGLIAEGSDTPGIEILTGVAEAGARDVVTS
jgi:hypothetical protein